MFIRESDMVMAATRWLEARGMTVKPEFVTPWGICDLVGLSFNKDHVKNRLKLRQMKPINSITRALLLLQVPDIETRKSVTVNRLVQQCSPPIPEDVVHHELLGLITDHFVVRTPTGRLQKANGWMPLQDRLVALELKLIRIEEAMHQALNHLGFADESYVGLPSDVATRVASTTSRYSEFFKAGVGLLSVSRQRCRVLVPAHTTAGWTDDAIQLYCVDKFWRTRVRARGN